MLCDSVRSVRLESTAVESSSRAGDLCSLLREMNYKKNGSVDLGHHTRGHTRYALGTHTHQHKETPRHSNGAKAHTRQVRCEFRQRSRRPLHPPPKRAASSSAPASDSSRAISHAAAMCSATDMRCAINDDHVRVVQLTSSSYCFSDNLSRTLSRI